jgi:putative hydrolase of the HAD superfamily
MPVRGVVFDLDETLIDRYLAVHYFAEALWKEYISDAEDVPASFIDKVHLLDGYGYAPRERFFESMIESYPDSLLSRQIVAKCFYEQVWETPRLADGVLDSLAILQQKGIPLAIVSNGSSQAQLAKVQHSGIEKYFDAIVVSEEFGVKKPDSTIYLEATSRLKAEPADCWFIGDHPINDVWGSKQVGFRSAWVHLDRPWASEVDRCYDVMGVSFKKTMSQVMESI